MYKKTQMKTSFWTAVILTLFIISSTVAQEMVESGSVYYPGRTGEWDSRRAEDVGMNAESLQKAVDFAMANEFSGSRDLRIAISNSFEPDNTIVGPTKDRGGPAGMVIKNGYIVAEWGDTKRVDMTFSATKSYLSTTAGLALDANEVSALHSGTDPMTIAKEARTPGESTVNRVLSLDGEEDCVRVADSQSLHSLSGAITIEVWFKVSSFYADDGSVNSIIRKNISPGAENFFLRFRIVDGQPLVEMSPGSQIGTLQAPHEFTTGGWYHLAGIYDGRGITIFVNGVRTNSERVSGPMYIDKSDLFIGKGDPEFSFGEYFHGALDEIRIWKVARSQEQIQATMNTTLTGKEQGLVAYWNFDDGTAKDLSGHGNDGLLCEDTEIVESSRPTVPIPEEQRTEPAMAELTTEKRLEILDIKIEPIRQGRNVVSAKVRNNSNEDRSFDIDIRTESSTGNWQTQFPHVIKGGTAQWIRHAYKINGPITEGLLIRLRFYAVGSETGADGQKAKHYFKEVKYYAGDVEHAEPDDSESEPATEGQRRAIIEALRQFQNCVKRKDYEAAWKFFSQDFRDAQLHGHLSTLQRAMETPYFLFPLSRAEVLALQPKSAGARKDILALTTALKNERWMVNFVKVADKWRIDTLERIDATPKKKIPLNPAAQEQALREAFEQWQNALRDKKPQAAWGLLANSLRRARQFENDLERFKKDLDSDGNPMIKLFLDMRPEAVTDMRIGESAILKASHADQPWKIRFVMEDGRWKIGHVMRGNRGGGDWQERLLPKMRKRITKHFDIFCYKGSTAEKEIDEIAERREKGFREICRFLGKDSDVRIRMVLFADAATKYSHTGHQGAGWAVGNMVVEIYNDKQRLNPYHETTHILMRPYGSPPALFNEGLAVYMSERLGARALKSMGGGESSVHERVKELNGKGEWILLEKLLTYTEIGSRETNPRVAYPEAASFVKFLIDKYGKDKFLKAYKTLRSSSEESVQKQNVKALQRIYGKSLDQLRKEWKAIFGRASVNAGGLPDKPHLAENPGSTVPPAQAQAVTKAFGEFQSCLKDEKYEQAWELTTQYFKDEVIGGGFEKFKEIIVSQDQRTSP